MAIQMCPVHNLLQNVICCEGTCLRRYCPECFLQHNEQHNFGVILNEHSKNSLIEWNQFLLDKFGDIQSSVKTKGINAIFEMKLNSNYPKGLFNQISNADLAEVSLKIIDEYLQTLRTNVEFVSTRQSLDQLDIPELFKDIFVFFIYDGTKGLNFLTDRVQAELKLRFPEKKMYDYVYFTFVPKEMRVLEIKRKAIVKVVEQQVILQAKKDLKLSSPSLSKSRNSDKEKSPTFTGAGRYTPRQNFNGAKGFGQNSGISDFAEGQTTEQVALSTPEKAPLETIQQKQQQIPYIRPVTKQEETVWVNFQQEPRFAQNQPEGSQNTAASWPGEGEGQRVQDQGQTVTYQQDQGEIVTYHQEQQQDQGQIVTYLPQPQPPHQQLISPSLFKQLAQKNSQLQQKVETLEANLKQKQRSIRELNNLIANQQQQLLYRQNQVQILSEQIRKLIRYKETSEAFKVELDKTRAQLAFKERSIAQLNDLIGNEEEEIMSRENQVETLTIEIRKLVEWRQRCEEIETKLGEKEKELDEREKGIKELNNVIGNQEEGLAYREGEVEMLSADLKKANQARTELESKTHQLSQQNFALQNKILQYETIIQTLESSLLKAQARVQSLAQKPLQKQQQKSFDDQLMEQVIELESDVVARNEDIKKLVQAVNRMKKFVPQGEIAGILGVLKNLKAVKFN